VVASRAARVEEGTLGEEFVGRGTLVGRARTMEWEEGMRGKGRSELRERGNKRDGERDGQVDAPCRRCPMHGSEWGRWCRKGGWSRWNAMETEMKRTMREFDCWGTDCKGRGSGRFYETARLQ